MQLSLPPLQQKSTGSATASFPSDFQLQSNTNLASQCWKAKSILILFIQKIPNTHKHRCVPLYLIRRSNINSRVAGIVSESKPEEIAIGALAREISKNISAEPAFQYPLPHCTLLPRV